ncbi:hypothetical protein IW261DRAFT_1420837 [Armillaria novae-zelandiae]|uniref:Uncharacterized protein n=1 Tax=Armillaria novae-zelandiae TaxID=153914 RepID=A0AA39P4N9_9AGAR|nr:hypothetical protein IW261DRAFT_1420837 [Armillaria novae-zelandiae]
MSVSVYTPTGQESAPAEVYEKKLLMTKGNVLGSIFPTILDSEFTDTAEYTLSIRGTGSNLKDTETMARARGFHRSKPAPDVGGPGFADRCSTVGTYILKWITGTIIVGFQYYKRKVREGGGGPARLKQINVGQPPWARGMTEPDSMVKTVCSAFEDGKYQVLLQLASAIRRAVRENSRLYKLPPNSLPPDCRRPPSAVYPPQSHGRPPLTSCSSVRPADIHPSAHASPPRALPGSRSTHFRTDYSLPEKRLPTPIIAPSRRRPSACCKTLASRNWSRMMRRLRNGGFVWAQRTEDMRKEDGERSG